jgi:glycerophosphoryl diester phosphodiesterase
MDRRDFVKLFCASAATAVLGCQTRPPRDALITPRPGGRKILIAHRGASAYSPENTLPAYELAMKQGADYVEQDLQITRDGVLVCCHDIDLTRVSNVKDVFPDRFTNATEKGKAVQRWWIYTFTLAELKQLDFGSHLDPKFKGTRIPTWQEAIDLIRGKAGLFPETKGPELYGKLGFNMEQMVVDVLNKNGLNETRNHSTPVFFQSFSRPSLERLNALLASRWPKLQLTATKKGSAEQMLPDVPKYATAIGPPKNDITAELVNKAHAMGLAVVSWTFSSDEKSEFASLKDQMRHYLYDLGVDAVFTNNPDQFPRMS